MHRSAIIRRDALSHTPRSTQESVNFGDAYGRPSDRIPASTLTVFQFQDSVGHDGTELLVESACWTDSTTLDEADRVDRMRDDDMAVEPVPVWRAQATTTSGGPGAESAPVKTVLVVEDDEAVSSLLVALLEERGYAAVPALDGRTAIELARKLQPHLITLDLALPGTDGHEVLESLKADPKTRDIPIVVISAFTQILPAGDRKKLAYLLGKPFDVTEVLEIVQATVGNPYV